MKLNVLKPRIERKEEAHNCRDYSTYVCLHVEH
jgi:hypothetical protein